MPTKIQYPWKKTSIGRGFFVPTLSPDKIKEDGLKAAVRYRIRPIATYGIKDGLIGVWFLRRL
jgi:hypothetical protein